MASPDIDVMTARMAGLGHRTLEEENEIHRIKRDYENTFEKSRQRESLDENDPKMFMKQALDQFKTLTTAVSVPLLQIVKIFEGEPSKFKTWEREIERYAQMAKLDDQDIPRIAYVTSTGSVELFIKRYLEQQENDFEMAKWSELKVLLQKRFGDVSDPQQAMAILRKIQQKPDESIQIFSERFLRVAEDAYPPSACSNETARKILEKQLVDIFCDSLHYDYLRLKVMREDPQEFETAVNIAINEQNLRKRFYLRSNGEETNLAPSSSVPSFSTNTFWAAQSSRPSRTPLHQRSEFRNIEPMDVDHLRRNICYKCKQSGHKSRECPLNTNTAPNHQINMQRNRNYHVASAGVNRSIGHDDTNNRIPDWVRTAECWNCHSIGHLQRNCPQRAHRNSHYHARFRNGNQHRQNRSEN